MEEVIIAVGSNLGERLSNLQKAGSFLASLSKETIVKSSIWESEPVGAAKYTFYNAAAKIKTTLSPLSLLHALKSFEQECGREKNPDRWGPRILDLDIIYYGNLVIDKESLIIPHPEYHQRLFVLLPLQEIDEDRIDPVTNKRLGQMISAAPLIDIKKTEMNW